MARGDGIRKIQSVENVKQIEKLTELYRQATELDEELLGDLIKKLSYYGKILELLGGIHAAALTDWKLAESNRREAIATTFENFDGSVAERTNKAESSSSLQRREEAKAEGEAMRWKNAYNSTLEQIQIMKLRLRDMKDVMNGG